MKQLSLAILLTLILSSVKADELLPELVMLINEGDDNITLTNEPCPVVNEQGFNEEALVTIEGDNYAACWRKDDAAVNVWFYLQPATTIASYHERYFLPKDLVK